MSTTYLRNTIFLLVGAFLLAGQTQLLLFQPMIGVIQNLSSEPASPTKGGPGRGPNERATAASEVARVSANGPAVTVAGVVGFLVSLASVVFTIRGVARDRGRRGIWVLLLIVAVAIFWESSFMLFVAPKFQDMFRDLGIGA